MIPVVSYTELDNMFFETLRLAVVEAGYLPDVTSFNTPDRQTNSANYKAAKEALRQASKLTEVFNTGSFEAMGEKTINKVVIVRGSKNIGTIGGWPGTQVVLDKAQWDDGRLWDTYNESDSVENRNADSTFTKSFLPDNSSNIDYQIKLITNNANWDNILSSIIDNVIPQKRFLNTVDDYGNYTDKAVLVRSLGDVNISAFNFMERTFRFRVHDVCIQNPKVLRTNIPVMSTVEFFVWGNPDMSELLVSSDGSIGMTSRKVIGYRDFPVEIHVVDSPSTDMQVLGNGDEILIEYAPNNDGTLTIPYLAGKPVLNPFMIDSYPGDPTRLTLLGDTWDNSAYSVFGAGSVIKLNVSLPLYE